MSVAWVLVSCYGCDQWFGCNPFHVPSLTVDDVLEPICSACVATVNPRRIANGLAPIVPHPLAYAPCDVRDWRYQ